MSRFFTTPLFLSAFLSLAAGCGGTSTSDTTPDPVDTTSTDTSASELPMAAGVRLRSDHEIPKAEGWETMSFEDKQAFMAQSVTPHMRALFREYDSNEFSSFGCADCHGPTMNERNFAMPNPDMYPLHDSGTPEQQAMVQEHPRMVRFMFNHVVPTMRDMIGEEDFNADTGEGFSCFFCHPHAE